jgi:hypothetical protein
MIHASCHCGAVQIEIDSLPETLTQCTCSICRRYGALWAYRTRETARIVSGQQSETPYLWNEKVIEFYHCNSCGCLTRYESVGKLDDSRFAVNARMIDPKDTAGLRIRTFDGADTWKYLDP